MINFERIFIGISQRNELFIGAGKVIKSGSVKWEQKSKPKTYEIINAVGQMMKNRLSEDKTGKPYFGYDLGRRIGKLVLVKPGYTFLVKKGSAEQPIQIE